MKLVAVNGLGGLEYLWEGFRALLPPGLDLFVHDLPGHGDRPPAGAAGYRYPALVADLNERTADLPAFPLVGWSVGGAVAWLFAAAHPERVTHLVLLDPAAPHQSPFRLGPTPAPAHPFTFASVEKAVEVLRGIDPTTTAADIPLGHRLNAEGRWEPNFDPAIFPDLVDDAREHGEEYFFELEKVRAPILLVFGERSFVRPGQREELEAGMPRARVETVRGAGHFMLREQPAAVARLVADFVRG